MEKKSMLSWITRIIAINLILQIILSYKLWLSTSRDFPIISSFVAIDLNCLSVLEYPLLLALVLSLLLIVWRVNSPWGFICFFLVSGVLVLQDINRLQSWFYQMTLLLMILSFGRKRIGLIHQVLCLALIFTYLWSGFHKLNVYFIEDVFPWFFEPIHLDKFLSSNPFLAILGAMIEMVLGVLLLFKASRKGAVVSLILFHLLVLAMLGPLGHDWNRVVWSWNIAMLLMVYLLFYQQTRIWKDFWSNLKSFPLMFVFILLFGLFPVFNLSGHWDDPLAFKMYAGTHPEGSIYFYKKEENCFPNYLKKDIFGKNRRGLVLDKWSFKEMQVSPYNAPRILKRIGASICNCLDDPENTHFEILTVHQWNKKKEHYATYPCSELINQ